MNKWIVNIFKQMRSQVKKHLFLILILIVTTLLYSKSLENNFTYWDDPEQVTENQDIQSITFNNIHKIFMSYYLGMYQPLTTLSFAIDYSFVGLNPVLYHCTNILFHLANVVLVFVLISRLSGRNTAGLIGACLFAIHPMHVESVAWITERKDVLYLFFFLLGLIYYLRILTQADSQKDIENAASRKISWKIYAPVYIFFFLSLLAKSAAVVFPLFLLLFDYYKGRQITVRVILEKVPFFIIALIFGFVSLNSQNPDSTLNFSNVFTHSDLFFFSCYSQVWYLFSFFMPINLSVLHACPIKLNGLLPHEYYFTPIIIIFLILLCLKKWRFRREIMFGLCFFLFGIILNIHIIPVGWALVAERYTYLPYIGLYFIIGCLFDYTFQQRLEKKFRSTRFIFEMLLIIAFMFFAGITYNRISIWKDTNSLFTDAVEKNPQPAAKWLFCETYLDRGEYKIKEKDIHGALSDYEIALNYFQDSSRVFYDRGYARYRLGNLSEAISDYNKAIEISPWRAEIYNERGIARFNQGDIIGAIGDYSKSINLDSTKGVSFSNRAFAYYTRNNLDAACADLKQAVALGYKDAELPMNQYCKGK